MRVVDGAVAPSSDGGGRRVSSAAAAPFRCPLSLAVKCSRWQASPPCGERWAAAQHIRWTQPSVSPVPVVGASH